MKNTYAHHHEQLEQRGLGAEQIRDVAEAVSRGLVIDVAPKLRSEKVAVKNAAVRTIAKVSCNSLAALYMLVTDRLDEGSVGGVVPDTKDVKDLLVGLERTANHIAKIQNPEQINENTAFVEDEDAPNQILKCLMRGAVLPTDITKTAECIDAYQEQAQIAGALIASVAEANPGLTSGKKFDTLYQENVALLDEFSE